jgi:hypothetical protein
MKKKEGDNFIQGTGQGKTIYARFGDFVERK